MVLCCGLRRVMLVCVWCTGGLLVIYGGLWRFHADLW